MATAGKFGRLPACPDSRYPQLGAYLTPQLPPPPATYDSLARVYAGTKHNDPSYLFPMDGNDRWGDCTIAALAHAQTVNRGLVDALCIWGEQDAVQLYFQLSGGVDSGLVETEVLRYWHLHPVNNDRILGYASVDPRNHEHVQQAISLFGSLYIGFTVPSNCIPEFEARQPWTPGPLTNEGHAVVAVGYDGTYVNMLTWGTTQFGTWDWWDECVDECYAIVPPEAGNAKFAPGFNVQQLIADLATVKD